MSTKTQSRTASRFSAKTLTMCAIFTALVAVCSQITIPLPIIPINLALFAVYLAGALLGPWRGALSLLRVGLQFVGHKQNPPFMVLSWFSFFHRKRAGRRMYRPARSQRRICDFSGS